MAPPRPASSSATAPRSPTHARGISASCDSRTAARRRAAEREPSEARHRSPEPASRRRTAIVLPYRLIHVNTPAQGRCDDTFRAVTTNRPPISADAKHLRCPNTDDARRHLTDPLRDSVHRICVVDLGQARRCSGPCAERQRNLPRVPRRQGREERGRQVDRGRRGEVRVIGARRASSSSAPTCHADVSAQKIPHAEKLKPVNCATCHEQAGQGIRGDRPRQGAQGRQRRSPRPAPIATARTTSCARRIRRRGRITPTSRPRARSCHGNDATMAKGKLPERQHRQQVPRQHPRQGAARAPRRARRRPARTATARTTSSPRASRKAATNRAKIPDTCGTCHKPRARART